MNLTIKKENGVVFTPEWVADFMIESLFKNHKIDGSEKILDAGCGEGVFTVLIAQKLAILTRKNIADIIADNIYFIDKSETYVERTKQNLQKLSNLKVKKYNAVVGDFCFHEYHEKFDFIIGNPPYVRIQNLNTQRRALQKDYFTASRGSIDLYFCFFERALHLLNPKGKIAFITPNSHFHSAAGKNLRQLILPHLTKIINFDHFQVFKDATAYTAITFLQNLKTNTFLYALNLKANFDDLDYKTIATASLKSERWEFFDQKFLTKINQLEQKYPKLHEVADIHYGIATLKDDIFIFTPEREDKTYFYFQQHKIEKPICVPIIKASTYKGKNQKRFLIFPYQNEKVLSENIMQMKYPETYKYLWERRFILEKRDKGKAKRYAEFYAFGRSQGLKTSFGKKIITSTMNIKPRFYVVEDEKSSFYAGYCIKPKMKVDLYELCEALNSNLMAEFIKYVSKSYRGGYKSYAKTFLKDFVHPQFDKYISTLF